MYCFDLKEHTACSYAHVALHLLPLSYVLNLPNDAAPLAVVLHALTINPFLFLFLHHASASMQLNLATPCMGNRPREAAMWLKIDFQVEYRALPLPLSLLPLHRTAADSSLHS